MLYATFFCRALNKMQNENSGDLNNQHIKEDVNFFWTQLFSHDYLIIKVSLFYMAFVSLYFSHKFISLLKIRKSRESHVVHQDTVHSQFH